MLKESFWATVGACVGAVLANETKWGRKAYNYVADKTAEAVGSAKKAFNDRFGKSKAEEVKDKAEEIIEDVEAEVVE